MSGQKGGSRRQLEPSLVLAMQLVSNLSDYLTDTRNGPDYERQADLSIWPDSCFWGSFTTARI